MFLEKNFGGILLENKRILILTGFILNTFLMFVIQFSKFKKSKHSFQHDWDLKREVKSLFHFDIDLEIKTKK